MTHRFISLSQERLFRSVIGHLNEIGYETRRDRIDSLLVENYEFTDHFSNSYDTVSASAAAFGQLPADPNTACFAVALADESTSGPKLINRYRALGAPFAFEIRDDSVVRWRVTACVADGDWNEVIPIEKLARVFREHRDAWNPPALMRAKNIAPTGSRQLDFVDAGLMPAIETHVHQKLDPLLRGILNSAKSDYRERRGKNPDADRLFRLVFRALTGKVMHDRGLPAFKGINGLDSPREFLEQVALHYDDPKPIINDIRTQSLVLSKFWRSISFAHLSIDVLAFVWENTLVSDELREEQGIHATPPNVARFVARTLIDEPPESRRFVVEPCCGSGAFLIAALQRLKELLPADPDLRSRHRFLANALRGFDTESFGLEVSQSCLTLADYPNRNGWYLKDEDVFRSAVESPRFNSSVKDARYVLCNPPFEPFSLEKRHLYDAAYLPPVELLHRVLQLAPADAEIGFVLPHQIIDGQAYSSLRRQIGERFASLHVVQLPENVFKKAKFPTALLVARDPRSHKRARVSFSYVSDAKAFVHGGTIDRTEIEQKSIADVEESLSIPELGGLWRFLSGHPKLQSAVNDIARGVEWVTDTESHILSSPRGDALPGFHTSRELRCFESPPLSFLVAEDKKYKAWERPWHLPKVVCNAVRKRQRGPWKIAACPVDLNLVCTQNFTVLWPGAGWTAKSLAAVMNGPVACAFMACHETWMHITKETLSQLPIPNFDDRQIATLDGLVGQYQKIASLKRDSVLESDVADRRLIGILKDIDSLVLLGYRLPRELVEDIVSFFEDFSRPSSVQYDIADLLDHNPLESDPQRCSEDATAMWSAYELSLRKDRV